MRSRDFIASENGQLGSKHDANTGIGELFEMVVVLHRPTRCTPTVFELEVVTSLLYLLFGTVQYSNRVFAIKFYDPCHPDLQNRLFQLFPRVLCRRYPSAIPYTTSESAIMEQSPAQLLQRHRCIKSDQKLCISGRRIA